jgi:NAD-dependent deacetylase
MKPLDVSPYRNIVILTGAGVSAASGLGTYRGPGGLWEQADIARIAHADNLPGTLPDLWRLYRERRRRALQAGPNAAHRALAALERRWRGADGRSITLVTQNVDGLHGRAGSQNVIEMHGSAFRTRCTNPRCSLPAFPDEALYDEVPTCAECGHPLRPDVVLFGEAIPARESWLINRAMRDVDLFLSAGTSGVVYPAAGLVQAAAHAGARTILVNLEPMMAPNPAFQEEYLGPAEELLPALLGVPPNEH